ncbi:uncharacterized protein MELLADRAFT_112987 [Melampsora larici-populina 98AG31]|uniref:Uncharacterized protein n=1 Tax=Melampsora larici-populina (strain 98AG31 / pathotype 3-4-7) TaxID=747676 RepID=F4S8B8_MELLP|nr:uncharacterized protein MELLADRAFT_112987 [Melampsora larici-populina 98AG31]EGF99069.1 hypothetical protein MELLADRAFT_112987 [Melampsora larici-populina 98AG31]
MLNIPYLIILALVCHTNLILSLPFMTLAHNGGAIRNLAAPHDLASSLNIGNNIGGISDVRYTQDLQVTKDGVRFHKNFPGDAELNLKRDSQLPQGREADNEGQPKAVIIGVRPNPENQEPNILLTQRVENNKGPIQKLKSPEFPRGHLLKDDLETEITFERLAELRKGPLADEVIPQGSTSDYILGVVMKKAGIDKNDPDVIPKLAAFRELYEETGHWGVLRKIDPQQTYRETKPEQSSKVHAGVEDYNKKLLKPFIIDIPLGQRPVFTLESWGRQRTWEMVSKVKSILTRREMQNIWTDLESKVNQIARKNAATPQFKFVHPAPAIPAN